MKEIIEGFKLLGALMIMLMYGLAIGLPFYNPLFFIYSAVMIVLSPAIMKYSEGWFNGS